MSSTITALTAHEWAVEVDTVLADLWGAEQRARTALSQVAEEFHHALGEQAIYRSRFNKTWPTTGAEAERLVREKHAAGEFQPWDMRSIGTRLAKADALRAEVEALREAASEFEGEFEALRWQRFFLVTNSGGHIHSSMACGTCYPTTQFAWLPALSGLTEAEAVEAHGTILCSVCFPSAPVAWTVGKAKPEGCAGTGQYVPSARRYVTCPVCEETVAKTPSGLVRKHKPKV